MEWFSGAVTATFGVILLAGDNCSRNIVGGVRLILRVLPSEKSPSIMDPTAGFALRNVRPTARYMSVATAEFVHAHEICCARHKFARQEFFIKGDLR
jgi:hypothetical protein